jgi:carboxylesterase
MSPEPPTEAGIIAGAETIEMQEGNSRGILLLHGFGDTPQTLRLLALDLHKAGYDVRVPLLPGHGRNVNAFMASRASEWLDAARSELSAMRRSYGPVGLVGLSMGGALAAILASEVTDTPALVLLAPYVDMPVSHKIASAAFWLWGWSGARKSNSPESIRDPAERAKNVGYGFYSARLLYELWRLTVLARERLHAITTPTLLVQSRTDPRIASAVAERAFAALGTNQKRLVWVERAGHIITVDYGREKVFDEVRAWMTSHMAVHTTTA